MGARERGRTRWPRGLASAMGHLNARHPWSHNDHFHPWILRRLPDSRRSALDVGCGRGELIAALAGRFERVVGIDPDAEMRHAASRRCAGLANVTIEARLLSEMEGPFDVLTMVAVLHHLEEAEALADVRRLLAPGGRFLCVGLARPETFADHAWDVASTITNPLIGYVKHPRVASEGSPPPRVPVVDPALSVREIVAVARRVLPGVRLRRHLAFRHTLEWTKPKY